MRPTKHDSLSGRKEKRYGELGMSKADIRALDKYLSGQPDRTELPKSVNIDERKRKNRARSKASKRVIRWQQRHRKAYNAKMRAYRQRKRAVAPQG